MLNCLDKQIIARDPCLPGLAALLDSNQLLKRLRHIAEFSNAVKVDVQYLRYKPQNSCAATLKITLNSGEIKFYAAKALTAERFQQSWNHPKRQMLIKERSPFAPFGLYELGILLIHPVYDRGIRNLDWLTDEKARRKLFAQSLLLDIKDSDVNIDILRYKPERRLVARVSENGKRLAVIRAGNSRDFSRMLTGAAFAAAQGCFTLLGADINTRTVITGWQKGHSLDVEQQGRLPAQPVTELIANKLAQLHQTAYNYPFVYSIDDEIQALRGTLSSFKAVFPEQVQWFVRLMRRIEQGLRIQPEKYVPVHGDFSLDQVIQHRNKQGIIQIHLIDWDRAAQGNPLMDLASMQARLELQVLEGIAESWQVENFLACFFNIYRKKTAYNLTPLPYFTASALLRLATEPFRKRAAHSAELILQLLQQVEILIENAEKPTALSAGDNYTDRTFSADPMLKRLTSTEYMQTVLTKILPAALQGHLEAANLMRYKMKRRALINYEIETAHNRICVIGKYRAKGPDTRSPEVQKALWNAGFNRQSQISVAEVLSQITELNTWIQRKENGITLGRLLLPDNGRLAFLGERAAYAINTLHQSAVAFELNLPVWTIDDEMEILRNRLAEVQLIRPRLKTRIADVSAQCELLAKQLKHTAEVTIHRDFYQDQILEKHGKPGEMVLLDLDLLCRGSAALDAGNYIAHIMEYALRRYGNIHALNRHINAFAHSFVQQSKTAVPEQIDAYTTLSLVRHIYLSTRFCERIHTTDGLLQLCENKLQEQIT